VVAVAFVWVFDLIDYFAFGYNCCNSVGDLLDMNSCLYLFLCVILFVTCCFVSLIVLRCFRLGLLGDCFALWVWFLRVCCLFVCLRCLLVWCLGVSMFAVVGLDFLTLFAV